MKKSIIFTLIVAVICASFAYVGFLTGTDNNVSPETVLAESINTEIVLQVDNPIMTVNGAEKEIDPGMGT